MKLTGYFDTLLTDTVNLSKFNLEMLDERVEKIYTALKSDPVLGPYVRGKIPQGSWAHRTIIKPQPGKEFDADFLLRLDEHPEWSADPGRYIGEVYAALGRNSVYGEMPRTRKCRCVRLTYANLCHVDIVPRRRSRRSGPRHRRGRCRCRGTWDERSPRARQDPFRRCSAVAHGAWLLSWRRSAT
jgi:hypothetical protein